MLSRPAATGVWLVLIVGSTAGVRLLVRVRFEDDNAPAIPHPERWRREEELYADRAAVAAPARSLSVRGTGGGARHSTWKSPMVVRRTTGGPRRMLHPSAVAVTKDSELV